MLLKLWKYLNARSTLRSEIQTLAGALIPRGTECSAFMGVLKLVETHARPLKMQ